MRWLLAACLATPLFVAAAPPQAKECVECHDTVNLDRFRTRSHGGLACVDCHTAIKAIPHDEKLPQVQCRRCHAHEVEDYDRSAHGVARAAGNAKAPWCTTCHGPAHEIVSPRDPASKMAKRHRAATCGTCHPKAFLTRVDQSLPHRASRMGIQKGDVR